MHRIAAEDIRHILWSSLPRPSPFAHLKRTQGEQPHPGFLLNLIGNSAKLEPAVVRESVVVKIQPARIVPDSSDVRLVKNVQDLCEKGFFSQAVQIVHQYSERDSNLEDAFYSLLLNCIKNKDLAAGREVHFCIIKKGFQQNAYVACHLIKMFAVCGSLLEANHVFSNFLAPDTFTWSAIISAYAYLGQGKQAMSLFEQMLKASVQPAAQTYMAVLKACSGTASLHRGRIIHSNIVIEGCELNVHINTMLIIMYAMCGSIDDAWKVFHILSEQDDVMCNVMMLACIHHGDNVHALQIFTSMQRKCTNSSNVIATILAVKACLNLKEKGSGKLLHSIITEQGFELNPYACSALMTMYVACNNLEEACSLFARLPKRTGVTWSFMIAVFSELNDYASALKYFKDMQLEGIKPNDVTYLSLLSACSHSGFLHEGLKHFSSMMDEHGVDPMLAHYNCIVDLLARLGHVVEAEDLLRAMPFKPDAIGCTALLSHHRTHGNTDCGRASLSHSSDLHLMDVSSLVMSELYHDAGW